MTSILTYQTVRAPSGDLKIYAVMNTAFIEALGRDDMNRLFSSQEDKYVLISQSNLQGFALFVDADKHEQGLTEAIDIIQDQGHHVDIRTQNIENRLGFGTDVNMTATSLQEALENVQAWLDQGVFDPEIPTVMEFPA